MPAKELLVDLAKVDFGKIVATIEDIRKYNPQRYQMEHLTAVVHEDNVDHTCVGYKDVSDNEFWVEGHMPGMPLMPGVIMLEAAAQLSSYYAQKNDLLGADVIGFGGLENVRFRDPVFPGDRLVLMCQHVRARRNRLIISRFQGVVRDALVVEGTLKGIAIPIERMQGR